MSSPSRTIYPGVTNDLERRVAQPKEGKPRYKVKRLFDFESFGDIREAIAREKAIKRMLRAGKIDLIESMNPWWQDLSGE